jgi:hypothetical protein
LGVGCAEFGAVVVCVGQGLALPVAAHGVDQPESQSLEAPHPKYRAVKSWAEATEKIGVRALVAY